MSKRAGALHDGSQIHFLKCDLFSQNFDKINSPHLLFFPTPDFLSSPIYVVPLTASHTAQLQGGTDSPSRNNVDFLCRLVTHPAYGFSSQMVLGP